MNHQKSLLKLARENAALRKENEAKDEQIAALREYVAGQVERQTREYELALERAPERRAS